MNPDPQALAGELAAVVTDGDAERFVALFAEDGVVWHSPTGRAISAPAAAAVIAEAHRNVDGLHYEDVHLRRTEDGFVQQHLLCGMDRDGRPFAIPCCLVVTTAGGRITRLDEYIDRSAVRVLTAPAVAPG